jgi:hypothetical protein
VLFVAAFGMMLGDRMSVFVGQTLVTVGYIN